VLGGSEDHVLSGVVGVVFSKCGFWYPVPHAVQRGAEDHTYYTRKDMILRAPEHIPTSL